MSPRPRTFAYAVTVDEAWDARSDRGEARAPGTDEDTWTPEHLVLAGLGRCSLTSLRYHCRRAGARCPSSASVRGTVTRRDEDGTVRLRRDRRPRRRLVRAQAGRRHRRRPAARRASATASSGRRSPRQTDVTRLARSDERRPQLDVDAVRARFTALRTAARVLRRARRHPVPRRGDRRDRRLPARVEREPRRPVRGEPPQRRAGRARARHGRRASSAAAPREIVVRPEHDALNFALTRALGANAPARGRGRSCTRLDHDGNVSPWLELARRPRPRRSRFVDAAPTTRRSTSTTSSGSSSDADARRRLPARRELGRHAHRRRTASSSWRTRRALSRGPTPSTTARTGRSTSRRSASTCCSARPTSSSGRTSGSRSAGRICSGSWRPYKVRPAADEPVGHRFEIGTLAHELLAGFVAAVDYVARARLGRDPGARARARRALPRGSPRRRAPSTDARRWTAACRRSRSASRDTRRARSPSTSPSGEIAVWDGDYYAVETMSALGLDSRRARSAPASSTTTLPTRSTGCSPGSQSST